MSCCALVFFFLMIRPPPGSTLTDTLFPYTTLFRSVVHVEPVQAGGVEHLISAGAPVRTSAHRRRIYDSTRRGLRTNGCLVATDLGGTDTYLPGPPRSEEHTSELQSLMRISYAVFCLKKKKTINKTPKHKTNQK